MVLNVNIGTKTGFNWCFSETVTEKNYAAWGVTYPSEGIIESMLK